MKPATEYMFVLLVGPPAIYTAANQAHLRTIIIDLQLTSFYATPTREGSQIAELQQRRPEEIRYATFRVPPLMKLCELHLGNPFYARAASPYCRVNCRSSITQETGAEYFVPGLWEAAIPTGTAEPPVWLKPVG